MAVKQAVAGTVKRSVTLRTDVDAGINELAGRRGYSAFLNDAAILALQARGVSDWIHTVEERGGTPLTAEDEVWARKRLAAARAGIKR
jgi:hypothetical protein